MLAPVASGGESAMPLGWEMDRAAGIEARWRRSVILPALKHPAGSGARSKAIREIAAKSHQHPSGKEVRISERTAWRWLAALEARGVSGLGRRPRGDRGMKKVLISRCWDEAVQLDEAKRASVRDTLKGYIGGLYAKGFTRRQLQLLAGKKLEALTRAAGCSLPAGTLKLICHAPIAFIRSQRHKRLIYLKDNDAKRFSDSERPRTRRHRDGLEPMSIVCADVHHFDIIMQREDGSTFTPKLIAFQDLHNNRIFGDLVFPPAGKFVRRRDVDLAFIRLTQDPDWGMPALLLIDNGKEFDHFDFISDAMKLVQHARVGFSAGYTSDHPEAIARMKELFAARRSAIIRSLPFNAAAKPIEGAFGNLERNIFSHMPGWIGGDRMRQKTANVGRPPRPFPGGTDEFCRAFSVTMDFYHSLPQQGTLAGKSPREAFEDAVARSWQRIDVNPTALAETFSDRVSCTVRQGEVRILKRRYEAPELFGLISGTKLCAYPPLDEADERVPLFDENGFLCFATPIEHFHILDPAGAKDTGRRRAEQNEVLASMRAEIDPAVDPMEEIRRATPGGPSLIAPSGGVIALGAEAEAIAEQRRKLPKPHARRGLEVNPELDVWRTFGSGASFELAAGQDHCEAPAPVPAASARRRKKGGAE